MKFRSLIILAVIPMVLLFQGCSGRIENVSSQSPYSELMGKKFILQQDFFIFNFLDDQQRKLVGNSSRCSALPKEVSSQFIGKRFNSVVIVGIVPKGLAFTVVRLQVERTIESSYRDVMASFEAPSLRGQIFDVTFLTKEKKPPEFLDSLAKPSE